MVFDCEVKWIKFEHYYHDKSHTKYVMKVRARTKFMRGLKSKEGCQDFMVTTRYSELLVLKHKLEKEIRSDFRKLAVDQ